MRRTRLISGLFAAMAVADSVTVWAASDSYASGFYTRGVAAAANIDQGSAVMEPFYIPAPTGALLPRISLAVEQDDNVFLDPTNATANTTISLVPGLLGIYGRPTANHLYADYGMIIPVYESEDGLSDRPSYLLRLGGVYQTGKSQIAAQGGYRRIEDVDTVVGARIAKQDWLGEFGVESRITGKSSLGLQGRAEAHVFDDALYIDYNRYYGAGRLYHRVSAKSQAFIQGGVGRDDPQDSTGTAAAADFYDLSLGVRGKQSPKFNSTGRVGYMWRNYDEEDRGDYSHWIASLQAESTPFGLTTFSGEVLADIRPAIDSADTDVIDQGLVLGAARRLFIERLRGNLSATLGQIDYSGARDSESENGRTDRYWGFSAGVDWWTKQRFSLGLAYSYMRREGSVDADQATQDATSYEVGRWTVRASWNY